MRLSDALQHAEDEAKLRDSYWVERAKLDFSMALEKQRRSIGMSYAAIAKKISTSAAYISKVFRGDSNMTIESMVKLARATGGHLNIQIVDEKIAVHRWDLAAKLAQPAAKSKATSSSSTVVYFPTNVAQNGSWAAQKAA